MLRLLITSAARTSARSLFTKTNSPFYASNIRTFHSKKKHPGRSPLSQTKPSAKERTFEIGFLLSGVGMAYFSWLLYKMIKPAEIRLPDTDLSKPTAPVEEAKQLNWRRGGNYSQFYSRNVHLDLPNISDSPRFKEVCDELQKRGIRVEQSGLGGYDIYYKWDGHGIVENEAFNDGVKKIIELEKTATNGRSKN